MKLSPGCGCCGCVLHELGVDDWTIVSGTKSESSGIVTLNGEFTPNSTVDEEAYTIVVNRFTGSFEFDIDGVEYEIDRVGSVITVTADGVARSMDTIPAGGTVTPSMVPHFQVRVTPNHIWVLAVFGLGELTPTLNEDTIAADGSIYTIVLHEITIEPSTTWTLTANGTYKNFWVASSIVQVTQDSYYNDTVVKDCFRKPSLEDSYQGYRCLLGPIANETSFPDTLFPDAGSSGNNITYFDHMIDEQFYGGGNLNILYEDIETKDGRGFCGFQLDGTGSSIAEADGTTYGCEESLVSSWNNFIGRSQRRFREIIYDTDGVTELSNTIFLRPLEQELNATLAISFPDETFAEPYPVPVFQATLSFAADFTQPDGERLAFGNVYATSFRYRYTQTGIDDDNKTEAEIPINDLANTLHVLSHEGTDYNTEDFPANPPSSFADDDWDQFDDTMTVYWNVHTS